MVMHYILSFGSNIGNRTENITQALRILDETKINVLRVSQLYTTSPVDCPVQDDFVNGACLVETVLQPEELLEVILYIEQKLGRERTVFKGPRTIDLDIILWEGGAFTSPLLVVPHPRAMERLFVVVPLLEIIDSPGIFGYYIPALHTAQKRLIAENKQRISPLSGESYEK